ncbi:hypothetical protein ACMFMG_006054 [Clarireedia jacksonii]
MGFESNGPEAGSDEGDKTKQKKNESKEAKNKSNRLSSPYLYLVSDKPSKKRRADEEPPEEVLVTFNGARDYNQLLFYDLRRHAHTRFSMRACPRATGKEPI